MKKLMTPKVQGALRHLLTAIGPVLAVLMASDDPMTLLKSLISPQHWPSLVGFLIAALGFYASWAAPEKKA